jgi:hypothetical protein
MIEIRSKTHARVLHYLSKAELLRIKRLQKIAKNERDVQPEYVEGLRQLAEAEAEAELIRRHQRFLCTDYNIATAVLSNMKHVAERERDRSKEFHQFFVQQEKAAAQGFNPGAVLEYLTERNTGSAWRGSYHVCVERYVIGLGSVEFASDPELFRLKADGKIGKQLSRWQVGRYLRDAKRIGEGDLENWDAASWKFKPGRPDLTGNWTAEEIAEKGTVKK